MFSEKERHWITGRYENMINYDSWQQWVESYVYKHWQYSPLFWNIEDTDKKNNTYTIQILYMAKDGQIKIVCVFILVKASDESVIREWLDNQKWLSSK
jgi:hypothetical protein